ncbi:Pyrophosphatase PpaX OS=Lysinibacillus sphaericus OX=1421 GN=LS41612_04260 PE=4 SV=1 [Lysinibacillus sphaericus]
MGTDDVQHVKPDPEPVLLALTRLGVAKEDAIMIGDNSHDIEAGHNAGVRAAGVAWSIKGEQYLQQFNPEYLLHHMKDLLAIVKEG